MHTSLYSEPTDTHQYLLAQSCHYIKYKKLIPYSQAVQMEQICFEEEDYNINWDNWNSNKLIGTTELRVLDEKYKE